MLRQRAFEADALHHVVVVGGVRVIGIEHGFLNVFARHQANTCQQLCRHRRVEAQAQWANRQAGTLRVFALAAEGGGKRLAHLKTKALFLLVGDALCSAGSGGCAHAFAVHQLHLGRSGEGAVAGHRHHVQPIRAAWLWRTLRFEQGGALRSFDQTHRHALAQAIHGTPQVGLHTLWRGRPIEPQHEELVFIDAAAGIGLHALHKRATAIELVAAHARQICAFGGFEPRHALHRAGHAGGQIALKVKYPGAVIQPAAGAFAGQCIGAIQGERGRCLGVAKVHCAVIQLGHHLPHPGHFALGCDTDDLQRMGLQSQGGQQPAADSNEGWAHDLPPVRMQA